MHDERSCGEGDLSLLEQGRSHDCMHSSDRAEA